MSERNADPDPGPEHEAEPEPEPERGREPPKDTQYVYPPECDRCPDGGDVFEWPDAGYWFCSQCGGRGSGSKEPIWWYNDPMSLHYDPPHENVPDPDLETDTDTETDTGQDSTAAGTGIEPAWRSALGTAVIVAVLAGWSVWLVARITDAPLLAAALVGLVIGLAGVYLMQRWRAP